jgi:hypothetical protein
MGKAVMTAGIASVGLIGLALSAASPATGDEGHGSSSVRELQVPADWEGLWSIRVEARDPATGALTSVDEGPTAICAGDSVGLSMLLRKDESGGCSGAIDGDALDLTCAAAFVHGQCRIDFRIDVDVTRSVDTISATGDWRIAVAAGDCAGILEHVATGESIVLTGARIGPNVAECAAPPASLIEKVLSHPELIALMPRPIDGLTAGRESTSIRLRWAAAAPAKAYEIQRSIDGGRFKPIAEVAGHLHSFLDRRLEMGREYRYIVRWIAPDGRISPASNEAKVQL